MSGEPEQMGPFMPVGGTRFETRTFETVDGSEEYRFLGATLLEKVVWTEKLYRLDLPDNNFESAIQEIDGLRVGEDGKVQLDPDAVREPLMTDDPREMDLYFLVGVSGAKEAGRPALALFEKV